MTSFKRRARLHQARWREARGIPIGSHPVRGDPTVRPLGSRVEWSHALRTGCNFLSVGALAAVEHRLRKREPHQTLDEGRLRADLLSSMPMCFNLFGDLHQSDATLGTAVAQWWPDSPGRPTEIRFEWSPGRLDHTFLGNKTAFDAAVVLSLSNGTRGAVGIETKYHEHPVMEKAPTGERLERYQEVSDRSGIFKPGATDRIVGTDLQQIWLDHLLILAMLQHPSGEWTWGRYVLAAPADNPGFARAGQAYADLLQNPTTFEIRTLESLISGSDALSATTRAAFAERYLDLLAPSVVPVPVGEPELPSSSRPSVCHHGTDLLLRNEGGHAAPWASDIDRWDRCQIKSAKRTTASSVWAGVPLRSTAWVRSRLPAWRAITSRSGASPPSWQ